MKNANARTSNLLVVILVGAILLVYWKGAAAGDTTPSTLQNGAALKKCIKHTEVALAHAKKGDAKLTAVNAKVALNSIKKINNHEWASKLQFASSKITSASTNVKTGRTEKAAENLKQALASIKDIVCCPKK